MLFLIFTTPVQAVIDHATFEKDYQTHNMVTSRVLVHNGNTLYNQTISSPSYGQVVSTFPFTQEFTTGPHRLGYRVSNVCVHFENRNSTYTWRVVGPSLSQSLKDVIIDTSTQQRPLLAWLRVCKHTKSTTTPLNLRRNTRYNVSITRTTDPIKKILLTRDTGEAGFPGWSIRNHNGSSSSSHPIELIVTGAPILGAPRDASVTNNYKNLDANLAWKGVEHASTGKVLEYRIDTCTSSCGTASSWTRLTKVSPNDLGYYTYTHSRGWSADRQYRIWAFNGKDWPAATVEVVGVAKGASIISTPASDNTYRKGENIDIAVDFDTNVNVVGFPRLHLAIGDDPANLAQVVAAYNRGSGTTRLVFRYTVPANLVDTTGLQLYSNPVRFTIGQDPTARGYIDFEPAAGTRKHADTRLPDWHTLAPRQFLDGRNRAPAFAVERQSFSISETAGDLVEAQARTVGTAVTATDADGDQITYSLDGSDAAFFSINSSTGQISTRIDESYDYEAKASYSVTLEAVDGHGGSDTVAVTINLTDVDEPPLAPDSPALSRAEGSTSDLEVSWSAPSNAGRPPITDYAIQYRENENDNWVDLVEGDSAATSTTIAGVRAVKSYQARVRAVNHEGDGPWSAPGSERANTAPAFAAGEVSRSVTETVGAGTEAAARNLGAAMAATDADTDTLTYLLEGKHRSFFAIDASTGQLTTKVGQSYDHEVRSQYRVQVKATDGFGGTARVKVKITVSDVSEPPLAPAAPTVSRISGTATSLAVSWTEPNNSGRPDIQHYDLQYRVAKVGTEWTNGPQDLTATNGTVSGLSKDTRYYARVRAVNDDGDGAWSDRGARSTRANTPPIASSNRVTIDEDGRRNFSLSDFGFSDGDAGDSFKSVKIVSLPSAGSLRGRTAPLEADDTVGVISLTNEIYLVYTAPANENGTGYASFSFKVSDGTDESVAAYVMTIDVTAVNDAATGQPTISGTARVGQTLSAAKGTVADVDGMPADSSFAWQWIRVDGSTESDISGATAGTYTLVAADAGKKVKVKLSFTDSDGTAESRTSAATATVGANARPTGAAKTVSTSEDTAYTFAAADFGFSDTDSGDALHSVKITALPAAGKGALALDGTAVAANGTVTKAELDDGDLVYTPPANENGTGYASFSFKVSDGAAESAAAYTITIDVTAVNDAATGQPTISGTARVGQTLSAAKGSVADVDGMPADSSFAWQWIRVDGSTESNISGATAGTYTLAAADQGKKLKVKLSFTDSDGTAESRTSAATATVGANARPTGAAKTVSTSEDTAYTFAATDFGFSDTDSGDAFHSVKITALPAAGKGALALDGTAVAANGTVTKAELDDGDLVYTPPANAHGDPYTTFSFKVSDGTDESASSYTITIDVTAVNDAATGQPAISGTARVGQTLSAAKGTVADVDGMPADSSFAWQWIRVDGSTESNISGATAGTYTLVAADAGKKVKVKLSFTDSDGTAESRTSAATATVGANARPTGAAKTVSTSEDTAYTFAAADFGFSDTDSGDAFHSVKITALPAAGKGALALDGTAVAANGTVTKAELDDGDLVYTPPANAHGDPYTTFTFKVSDGTDESASSYTITIDVTAVNDAATGQPAISGTARVGQALSAAKGTVADVDGMPADSSFAWQWIRVDGSSESNISGATAGTYTLAAADQGKKLKVKLSFTDSDGTAESRTSAATATVGANARPTGAAKTVSTSEDTAYTFAAADFGFTDTDSGDTLHSVKITAPPAAGKGALALDGTAVAANGTVTKAELDDGDLVYTPPANAHGDPYTTFTFKVSDGTDESASSYTITIDVTAVNDAATGQPAISGTTRVGQTLSAAKGTVADVDGMPADSSFAWQWIRVDGSSESNISGATAGTYTLAAADQGKKLKVKLSFTDSDGTAESRTSAATATVGANARPTGAAKTVSTSEDTAYTFAAADFGFSDTDSGDALHSVKITALPAAGKGALALDGTAVAANGTVTKAELDDGDLVYTPPANAHGDPYTTFSFKVSDGTDESASSYTITIDVTAVNDAATGQPAISGTARVGQALSAAKGTVADVDGMPADSSFAWQWIRVDGSTESNISGATAGTYTLAAADQGKKLKVKLSFTDSDGTAESRTSAATATVGANARPTGAAKTVSTSEDTAYTFAAADFGFSDTDSGDTLHSVKITALPAAGKGALALDGTAVAANGTVTKAELDDGDLVYTPPANENGSGYASFSFKVSDGAAESAAAYTITIDVTAVNDAATGQPTISGTARVGQTLSAAKGSVADVDGMPADSSFAWQWIRVDGSTESDISGATAGTYTLAAADQGKKLKVKLSFTVCIR